MTTGTIRLKGTFPNADRKLWPGEFVRVTLRLTTQPNALVVPNQAVQTGQDGPFVFVVKPDRTVESRPIATGPRWGVPEGAGIRIKGVTPADDPAVTSELQVEVTEQPGEDDEVIDEAGARVFVEGSVCGYLADKLLDAEMVEERIRFSLAGQAASPGSR